MKISWILWICVFVLLAKPAIAVEIVAANVDRKAGHYYVNGTSIVQATPELVYATLMDYDNFHKLASGLAETRFVDSEVAGEVLGYTRFESCVLFFCKTVVKLERIEATPYTDIKTIALPEQSDFVINEARWQLIPEGDATRLVYTAQFKPDFWMPPLIDTWAIKRKLIASAELIGLRIEYLANHGLTLAQLKDPDAKPEDD